MSSGHRAFKLGVAVVLTWLYATGAVWASEPPTYFSPYQVQKNKQNLPKRLRRGQELPSLRLIWTPVDAWQELLKNEREGLVVPYEQLYKRWQAWVKQQEKQRIGRVPVRWLLQRVVCQGEALQSQQAHLRLAMDLRVERLGWHQVFLPLEGIAISKVRLEGIEGSVHSTASGFWLQVWGPAKGRLLVEGGSVIRKTPRGSVLAFRLPKSLVSQLRLRLPAHQEVKGAPLGVHVVAQKDATLLEGALQPSEAVRVLFRPREGTAIQRSLLDAHVKHRLDIRSNVQWLYADVNLRWRLGQRTEAKFQLPRGFRLVDIRSSSLIDFSLRGPKKREVWVRLRAQRGVSQVALHLRMLRQDSAPHWTWQPLQVADAYVQQGELLVQIDRQLRYRSTEFGALHRVVVPSAKTAGTAKKTSLRFTYWRPSARLKLTIQKLKPRFDVSHTIRLSMKVRQARLETEAVI
ncbi:MAG: hypothetical protein H6727_01220, partial [Myxococcales bacterium]|nr:hypothetical protein [Myxococcales bacterium]